MATNHIITPTHTIGLLTNLQSLILVGNRDIQPLPMPSEIGMLTSLSLLAVPHDLDKDLPIEALYNLSKQLTSFTRKFHQTNVYFGCRGRRQKFAC